MKWPCEETTLDFEVDGYEIRLWITFGDEAKEQQRGLGTWQTSVGAWLPMGKLTPYQAATVIAERGAPLGLAAVQVRQGGFGHMIYTIPFAEAPNEQA